MNTPVLLAAAAGLGFVAGAALTYASLAFAVWAVRKFR